MQLTKEQQDIKKAAREFALGEFSDVAREYDINETVPMEIIRKAQELGLVGLFIPDEYDGPGFGFLEWAMVLEEFWRVDPGIGQQLSAVPFGAEEIMLFGTEEQKKKWLPRLFLENAIMGFSITEPDAGSDLQAKVAGFDIDSPADGGHEGGPGQLAHGQAEPEVMHDGIAHHHRVPDFLRADGSRGAQLGGQPVEGFGY